MIEISVFRLLSIFRINTIFPKSQTDWCALAHALNNVLLVLYIQSLAFISCIHFICCLWMFIMKTLTSVGCLQTLQVAHELFTLLPLSVCHSFSLSFTLPHTEIWCSPSLKPVVVMLSIVWWSAKDNSSQKKTVASAACFCSISCSFMLFFFSLSHDSTLSAFTALSLVCVSGQFCGCRSRKKACVCCCFSSMGRERPR